MKILVLGSTGLLGQSIVKKYKSINIEVVGVARKNSDFNFDVTDDMALKNAFDIINPDVVINAIAIVDLNYCENNPKDAYMVNARLVQKLVELCRITNAYLVQISTDHYYSNDGEKKHSEVDPIRLVNEYAMTKYIGESFACLYENSLIIRTNIIGFRNTDRLTFLEWVIDSLTNNKAMTLYNDFYTSSIHTKQLSDCIVELVQNRYNGILNVASSEVFTKEKIICSLAKAMGVEQLSYESCSVNQQMTRVKRANSLGLNVAKAEQILGHKLPTLQDVLISIMNEYRGKNNEI